MANKRTMTIFVVLLLVAGLGWMYYDWAGRTGGIDNDTSTPLSLSKGEIDVALSLTGVTSGVTENNQDPDHIILTVTSADLNSANETIVGFTLNLRRTDNYAGLNNAGENFLIKEVKCAPYVSYADGTNDQYTCGRTSSNYYNYTIGGIQGKNGDEKFYDLVALDSTSTTFVNVTLDDYTTYDANLVQDNYNYETLSEFVISHPQMSGDKTVSIRFMKD